MAKNWFFKFSLIGLITLVMVVAMFLITGLVDEREARQHQASAEIRNTWSGPQRVGGPVLTVPLRDTSSQGRVFDGPPAPDTPAESSGAPGVLYLLPESLRIETRVTPHLRHRGLFETVVYSASLTLRGHFEVPELSRLSRDSVGPPPGDRRTISPGRVPA